MVSLAVVVAAGLVATNAYAERRELDGLLARVADAQEAIAYSNRRIEATVDYTRPLLFGANAPARVRAGLQQLVADSAAGEVSSIEQQRDRAAEVRVLRWHGALRRARAALVAYLDGRVAYLRDIAGGSRALYVVNPRLERLLDETRKAFRAAAGPAHAGRVTAAFAGGTHPA